MLDEELINRQVARMPQIIQYLAEYRRKNDPVEAAAEIAKFSDEIRN